MNTTLLLCGLTAAAGLLFSPARGQAPAPTPARITILFDAFGPSPGPRLDWGFAAFIEYGGRRVLFDTGNNAETFAANAQALGVDLTRLDAVVISHRHGDHTDGLRHLLRVNPQVRIYAPRDEYFGGVTPAGFFRRAEPALPARMRYFQGQVPARVPHGSPWRAAHLTLVDSAAAVLPGFRVVRNLAPTGQPNDETPELSLAIQTPGGQVLVVGCSHPGIERILASVAARQRPVQLLVGGLHLVETPRVDQAGAVSSFSRPGNPYNNAQAEAGWSTLKIELLPGNASFASLEDARLEIAWYLDTYFNLDRRHSALGYRSPHQFEQDLKINLP